jgi:hypothetical protein
MMALSVTCLFPCQCSYTNTATGRSRTFALVARGWGGKSGNLAGLSSVVR